ncbi:MAG: CidA/LrgA family protein [Caulobacteraceae bacterium]|nr:CidA/LrgA family protein [Caulobacteraceae bacterium]
MTARQLSITVHRGLSLSRVSQIGLLTGLWVAGELIVRWARLPIPGSIVGLFIALALLGGGWLRLSSVRRGAEWLLAEMMLFFVPAVVAVVKHHELLGWLGLKILAVILLGTVAVMAVTALTVELCCRWNPGHEGMRHAVE